MGKKKVKAEKTTASETNSREKDSKYPKSYSFGQVKGADTEDPKILKISLPTKIEERIKEMLIEYKERQILGGSASLRLTRKKLTDVYTSLSKAGFKHNHIEQAMSQTVHYGGDLIDALDWLCLYLPNDQLPDKFSQTFFEEETRLRPERAKFDVTLQNEAAAVLEADNSAAAISKRGSSGMNNDEATVKDWILRYAEGSSDSCDTDDDDCSNNDGLKQQCNDPNDSYLELTAKLLDAKSAAVEAKAIGDKKAQKLLSQNIRDYKNSMSALEKHPSFNAQVKISGLEEDDNMTKTRTCKDQNNKKQEKQEERGEEEFGFDLFSSAAAEKPEKEQKKPKVKRKDLEIRNFEYTRKQWTGKSPKQFLIDWIRKNLKTSPPPAYKKIEVLPALFRSKCTVVRKDKANLDVTPDIVCENVKDAEHLASTLALYHLCRGQRVYQLLPPPYRDVWLGWLDAEKKQQQEVKEEQNKPRDALITKLIKKVTLEDKPSNRTQPAASNDAGDEDDDDDDDGESWLALADSDDEDAEKRQPTAKPNTNHRQTNKPTAKCFDAVKAKRDFEQRTQTSHYQDMLSAREQLPVYGYREAIIDKIRSYQVVVISGQTGSGKSTQIPRFILEEAIRSGTDDRCNILCTEPRRISAISLAQRVSSELADPTPIGSAGCLCGYQIRMESTRTESTRLLYCTTGVLLRRLQVDPTLTNVTHIVVDEVHERSVQSDFLLVVLRRLLDMRRGLHLILMSATADSDRFSAYFKHCPIIDIPGRTFPVQVYHVEDIVETIDYKLEHDSPYALRYDQLVEEESAELSVTTAGGDSVKTKVHWTKDDASTVDYSSLDPSVYNEKTRNTVTRMIPDRVNLDLIVELIEYIDSSEEYSSKQGSILVFLPGLAHIQELHEMLSGDRRFSDTNRYRLIALHSVLSSDNQSAAFISPPPGVRKVVIATNIAETGITIPDVVFVIDAGREKQNRYSESSQMSSLLEVFISQASAKQRQGRAGRVQPGVCFRLYTRHKYETMKAHTIPEMLRVPLEELCLHIMKCELGEPCTFLSQCLDPPTQATVSRAMSILREIGACDASGVTLTPLGQHLATLPVNVRIGKMLIYGAIFGCLEQVSVIAAAMTDKSPFVVPLGKKNEADIAKRSMAIAYSDHLTLYKAYAGWIDAKQRGYRAELQYCQKHFLKRQALLDIENVSQDLRRLIQSSGFVYKSYISGCEPAESLIKNKKVNIVKAVLLSGMYPQLARVVYTPKVDSAASDEKPHLLATTPQGPAHIHPGSVNKHITATGYLIYHEKVKLSRVFLRETTLATPLAILIFGGEITIQHREQLVSVDDWIHFKSFARTAVIVKELRIMLNDLLERKLRSPDLNTADEPVVRMLIDLLTQER